MTGGREKQISHGVLVMKLEGMRRLSRPKFRWQNNNEIGIKGLG